jgi:hypothetical protein
MSNPNGSLVSYGTQPGSLADYQLNSLMPQLQTVNNIASNLPTSYDVNSAYNNPYTSSIYNYLAAPLQRQYTQNYNDLNTQLNAQNQLGSSYAALKENQLQQNQDYNLQQAMGQAMQYGNQAYQQSIQDPLNVMQGVNNTYLQGLQALYQPYQFAGNYQAQAINPVMQAQANYLLGQQQQQSNMLGQIL